MKQQRPFRFKAQRKPPPLVEHIAVPPVNHVTQKERLTGFVQGQKATSLEERFANALNKLKVDYVFQAVIDPGMLPTTVKRNLPGELQIDFLILRGGIPSQPIQIDGQIAHYKSDWQKIVDTKKDAGVNDVLSRAYGAQPVIRVPYEKILTPAMTEIAAKEILL